MHMEHPIKRESIHDSETTDRTIREEILPRSFFPNNPRIVFIYRRGTTPISYRRTLRDDNRQIYETAYRSSTKSNFRVRRSRIIVSPAFPRHEVCVRVYVCREFPREGCRSESFARIFWNILKYRSWTSVEHIVFWRGDPVSIVSLGIPHKLDWLEANIDFCFGWRSNWWICTVFPWASLWSWNGAELVPVSDLF